MHFKNACDISGGFSKSCASGKGGIIAVTFIQKEHLTASSPYTLDADNIVTAINLASGYRGYKYALEMNISTFTDTLTRSRDNGTLFAQQALSMILNDNRAATRNQVMLLAQNDLISIVHLADGTFEMLGADNGLTLDTDERNAGVTKADRNGHTINLVGQENELAYTVDSTIIAGLLIPAS